MTSIDDLMTEQDTDREQDQDYETGALLRAERTSTPRLAVLAEDYRPRPQRNLRAARTSVSVEDLDGEQDYLDGEPQDETPAPATQTHSNPAVGAHLVNEGHGFTVRKEAANPDTPEVCRYCRAPLRLERSERCEFAAAPTHPTALRAGRRPEKLGVPVWDTAIRPGYLVQAAPVEPRPVAVAVEFSAARCRCNGCRGVVRDRGRPEVTCGSPQCTRAHQNDRAARSRAVRQNGERNAAYRALLIDSSVSDWELAERLGIRRVRVKEARRMVTANS